MIRALLLAGSLAAVACGGRLAPVSPPLALEPVTAPAPGLDDGSAVGVLADQWEAAYAQLAADAARATELAPFTDRLANWPIAAGVRRITSPWGPRWGGFHNGVDIAAPLYTPVQAAAAGQVVVAGKPFLAFGDTATIVIIAHGNQFATLYAHLNDERPPLVQVGQHVTAGQVIAFNGSTGWSTGPHVHFTTVVNGRPVDPMQSLP